MTTRPVDAKVPVAIKTTAARAGAKLAVRAGSVHGLPAHVNLRAPRKSKAA